MIQFQTIQKVAQDSGFSPSTIRAMVRDGTLTKCFIEGTDRVLIDTKEFNSKVKRANEVEINIDNFLVS